MRQLLFLKDQYWRIQNPRTVSCMKFRQEVKVSVITQAQQQITGGTARPLVAPGWVKIADQMFQTRHRRIPQ